jgi:hypothetical protein
LSSTSAHHLQPLLTSSPPPTTHSPDTSVAQPQHLQPMD